MQIVLGTLEFGAIGGAATYTLTVAGELQRLGHEVTIFAGEAGELAKVAEEQGIRVAGEADLPADCDVVYSQDRPTAYLLADRFPGRPQALCMHSGSSQLDRWQPPQLPGIVGAVVVLHDRLARRAEAFAQQVEIVRLRQPVDLARFAPRGVIDETPQRALLLGDYPLAGRREAIHRACEEAGLECTARGRYASQVTLAPEQEINQVDIVIGSGRAIIEAMACARAAFVYGSLGGDGWVTRESYPALESINFAHATDENSMVTPEELTNRLSEYRQSMGSVNLDLARVHHNAARHAEELVDVFGRLAPARPPENTPLREFARMSRVQWQTESRALGLAHEARVLSSRAQTAEARAEVAEARLRNLRSARWYRFLRALARPFRRGEE
jgi:hypothetical protein